MKQAKEMVKEIERKKQALKKTKSEYLKKDYDKSIKSDFKELKDYCKFRGLDFKGVLKV